mgnify:CR=1 FL=1
MNEYIKLQIEYKKKLEELLKKDKHINNCNN